MHSTEWGRKTHHEPSPKTGLRAQFARGFHLTLGSLRVLATEPRLMVARLGNESQLYGALWGAANLVRSADIALEAH